MKIRIRTVIVLLLTCFVIPFVTPVVIDFRKYGLFFGWEIGTILQTFYAFKEFAFHNFPPHISSDKHVRNTLYILSPIIISCLIYLLIKTKILESFLLPPNFTFYAKDFIISLFRDSITLVPMVVFFLFNLKFYWQIRRLNIIPNETYTHYLRLLKRVILTVDIPCLIPYITVIFFAYHHFDKTDFQFEAYLSGAGSLLLMVSNFLVLFVHSAREDNEWRFP